MSKAMTSGKSSYVAERQLYKEVTIIKKDQSKRIERDAGRGSSENRSSKKSQSSKCT